MNHKQSIAALITAAALLASTNSASAFGWDMSWFTFGYSSGGIALNGTSLTGLNQETKLETPVTALRITKVTIPQPGSPVPIPYPGIAR